MNSRSGPNSFGTRLAKALANRGHILADPNDYDVAIAFIEASSRVNTRKPLIHRLDGIWFKPNEFLSKNVGIKRTYDAAQTIVFQSEFDKKQITNWWPTQKNTHVIHNGVDKHEVQHALNSTENKVDVLQLRERFEHIFVCSSNWHPQKRFMSNVQMFEHLRNNFYPYSCLVVLGSNPPVNELLASSSNNLKNNIYFAGNQPHQACLQIYNEADWFLHLAWLDHCPNVVCEALACSTPVICASDGGTKELIGDCGIVIQEKIPYNFALADYDNPPTIDVTQITSQLPSIPRDILNNHKATIDISNSAIAYENIMHELL